MLATRTESDSRIESLSRPKPFVSAYREDKPSVYWTDFTPFEPSPDGHTVINASERVQQLSAPKKIPLEFKLPRFRQDVKKDIAEASDRVIYLANPKSEAYRNHQLDRGAFDAESEQKSPPKMTEPTERIKVLATPKARVNRFEYHEDSWGEYVPVSKAAMTCKDNPRIDRLAEPKWPNPQFHGAREIQWPVSESALKSIASLRLQQLARPKSRTLEKDDYDPFQLSAAAKKAKASARIEELSQPIARKVRQKKT